jgi:hypothetical protein
VRHGRLDEAKLAVLREIGRKEMGQMAGGRE